MKRALLVLALAAALPAYAQEELAKKHNCFACHADKKQKGDLRLDSLTAMLEGGDSGPALCCGSHARILKRNEFQEFEMVAPNLRGMRRIQRGRGTLTRATTFGANEQTQPVNETNQQSSTPGSARI